MAVAASLLQLLALALLMADGMVLTVPLVPLLFVSSIVLTDTRPVHFPICPVTYHGRRHSAAVFPPLVLRTNLFLRRGQILCR